MHCPTQELITIKKEVTLIWGLQIVYQLDLTIYIYSFRARALKRKKKMIGIVNLRYASDILLKLAGSFNFINTDYKITTNTIILRMGSHYRIFYFAVNIL